MAELPVGTVTFLFSDIEGSTRLLRELGEDWEEALTAHNRILRDCFAESGGREVDRQGDAFFAVFPTAKTALAAASDAQRTLAAHAWPREAKLRVRMGVHTGEPSVGGEGYLGVDVVRAARICSAAHGGQVLVSESARALVGSADLEDLGLHHLKDMEHSERLFQLVLDDLPGDFPAPRTLDRPQEAPPAVEFASHATSLAKRFESLGPRVEQQVRDSLAAQGIPPQEGATGRRRRHVRIEAPALPLLALLVAVPAVVIVAIIVLLLRIF